MHKSTCLETHSAIKISKESGLGLSAQAMIQSLISMVTPANGTIDIQTSVEITMMKTSMPPFTAVLVKVELG